MLVNGVWGSKLCLNQFDPVERSGGPSIPTAFSRRLGGEGSGRGFPNSGIFPAVYIYQHSPQVEPESASDKRLSMDPKHGVLPSRSERFGSIGMGSDDSTREMFQEALGGR